MSGRYTNTVTKTYDLIGRTSTEALTTNGQTYTVGYTSFDDDSRLTTLTYPDSTTVTRTYTARNQRQETRYQGALIADYTYDAGMRETQRTLGNGLDITRAYRQDFVNTDKKDNLLASITVETALGLNDRQSLSLSYTYDKNKNMTAEAYAGGVMVPYGVDLVQDAKDRMTSWTRDTITTAIDVQTWSLNFENDWDSTTTTDAGTSTTEGRTHDSVHQLTEIDPDNTPNSGDELGQTYDAKGNLSNDGMGRALTHDFDNMLSQVTVSPGASQATVGTHSYAYDALGQRVSKTVNGMTTVFVCSGGQVLAEYTAGTAAASPDRKYVYGVYIDEPIALIDRTATGNIAAGTDEIFYYHRNRQYSIIGLSDSSGAVVERYAYTAYGKPTILAPDGVAVRAVSSFGNVYMHTGRRFDLESGLYYYRARYYGPLLGRFLERDPLGYPDGLNTYVAYHVLYSGVDPSGMATIGPHTDPDPTNAVFSYEADNGNTYHTDGESIYGIDKNGRYYPITERHVHIWTQVTTQYTNEMYEYFDSLAESTTCPDSAPDQSDKTNNKKSRRYRSAAMSTYSATSNFLTFTDSMHLLYTDYDSHSVDIYLDATGSGFGLIESGVTGYAVANYGLSGGFDYIDNLKYARYLQAVGGGIEVVDALWNTGQAIYYWDASHLEESTFTAAPTYVCSTGYYYVTDESYWNEHWLEHRIDFHSHYWGSEIWRSYYDDSLLEAIHESPHAGKRNDATRDNDRCFVSGTMIKTPDGFTPIEELQHGDTVLALNPNGLTSTVCRVLRRIEHSDIQKIYEISIKTSSGRVQMTVTGEHPIWVKGDVKSITKRGKASGIREYEEMFGEGSWLYARDLVKGDQLLSMSGDAIAVESIQVRRGKYRVYNITVEGLHNYAVTEAQVVVHNK